MTEPKPLTPRQQKMLTGAFYIDGGHNQHCLDEADDLVERGLLTVHEGGDDQHTIYHYKPKDEPNAR